MTQFWTTEKPTYPESSIIWGPGFRGELLEEREGNFLDGRHHNTYVMEKWLTAKPISTSDDFDLGSNVRSCHTSTLPTFRAGKNVSQNSRIIKAGKQKPTGPLFYLFPFRSAADREEEKTAERLKLYPWICFNMAGLVMKIYFPWEILFFNSK